ncbi:MAG TPA: hypothetical protein VMR19_00750 [Candidatus Saccharimonadales bacterium]|nr:hypothetical protein [Candidatus Saccharimonadales bacterium]
MERERPESRQGKVNFFLVAGILASTVSVPVGLTFLGIAVYEYIRMRGARKS